MQHPDYPVATQVGGVGERRTPVAVAANQRLSVEETGVRGYEPPYGVDVISPDRINELHRVHQSRPARRLVAPGEHELRVGESCIR